MCGGVLPGSIFAVRGREETPPESSATLRRMHGECSGGWNLIDFVESGDIDPIVN